MPLAVHAIEQFGWKGAFEFYSFLQDLVQTDETVLWLMRQLKKYSGSKDKDERRFARAITSWLAHSDVAIRPPLIRRLPTRFLRGGRTELTTGHDVLLALEDLDPPLGGLSPCHEFESGHRRQSLVSKSGTICHDYIVEVALFLSRILSRFGAVTGTHGPKNTGKTGCFSRSGRRGRHV